MEAILLVDKEARNTSPEGWVSLINGGRDGVDEFFNGHYLSVTFTANVFYPMIKLSNRNATAVISEVGAELQSLRYNDVEYLWQADPAYWAKHSPVLFPIVGELKDGKYFFQNTEYRLPRHGFAREKTFKVERADETSVVLTLHEDEKTLQVYPFQFLLSLEYTLLENKLTCTYQVQNRGNADIYFSVGGHPAFNVPLKKGLEYADYFLKFNGDERLQRFKLKDGLLTDETTMLPLDDQRLMLSNELFYADAIVLKNINSHVVTLATEKDAATLQFTFKGFPFFGIWAAKDAPFVCLEPWCGIADAVHHDQELTNKEGIIKLAAGDHWERGWSVRLF